MKQRSLESLARAADPKPRLAGEDRGDPMMDMSATMGMPGMGNGGMPMGS